MGNRGSLPCRDWTYHAMEFTVLDVQIQICLCFPFLSLSVPKVDFFLQFVSVLFQSQCQVTACLSRTWGWPDVPMISSLGMCLIPGTAEFSVVCQGFFPHEIKNWCCQKMIVTICLTIYVFLNFANHLCF